jgi:glycosyltransferase involved in cell wall biosynthesis
MVGIKHTLTPGNITICQLIYWRNILEKKVLALIPAYNEGAHIKKVIDESLAYLPVLVIDDGSKDNTVEIVAETNAEFVQVTPNQGKGNALKTGFHWALEHGYDGVLTLDADGQHDPQEIPLFLDKLQKENVDLIIGSRNFSEMPFSRKFANSFGRVLFSWAMRQPSEDNHSGYRYISKALIEIMLDTKESGFEFEVEMILICLQHQLTLAWVPIKTIYGDEKSHIQPIRHILRFISLVLRVRRATS